MSLGLFWALVGALLFALGLAGLILQPRLLGKIVAFNILGSGAFLVLVGLAQRGGLPDPVPQAMVLTGIVVAVAATALALALTRRWVDLTGSAMVPGEDDRPDGDPDGEPNGDHRGHG